MGVTRVSLAARLPPVAAIVLLGLHVTWLLHRDRDLWR